MQMSSSKRQRGMSGIAVVILLLVIAGGVFFGMQYIPQKMEAGKVDSILESIEAAAETGGVSNKGEVEAMLIKRLQVNNMLDLLDAFTIGRDDSGEMTISAEYRRELNLLYEKRPVIYSRSMVLNTK